MRSAVFLDRDGTLNCCFPSHDGKTRPPSRLADVRLVDGAVEACTRLRGAGYLLLAVTNQPDIRRGTQSRDQVEQINQRVVDLLGLDDLATCYHDNRDRCGCRKPEPGMILTLADRHGVHLPDSWMLGDRCTDIVAGRSAGCATILVSKTTVVCNQDFTATSLSIATDHILGSGGHAAGLGIESDLSRSGSRPSPTP